MEESTDIQPNEPTFLTVGAFQMEFNDTSSSTECNINETLPTTADHQGTSVFQKQEDSEDQEKAKDSKEPCKGEREICKRILRTRPVQTKLNEPKAATPIMKKRSNGRIQKTSSLSFSAAAGPSSLGRPKRRPSSSLRPNYEDIILKALQDLLPKASKTKTFGSVRPVSVHLNRLMTRIGKEDVQEYHLPSNWSALIKVHLNSLIRSGKVLVNSQGNQVYLAPKPSNQPKSKSAAKELTYKSSTNSSFKGTKAAAKSSTKRGRPRKEVADEQKKTLKKSVGNARTKLKGSGVRKKQSASHDGPLMMSTAKPSLKVSPLMSYSKTLESNEQQLMSNSKASLHDQRTLLSDSLFHDSTDGQLVEDSSCTSIDPFDLWTTPNQNGSKGPSFDVNVPTEIEQPDVTNEKRILTQGTKVNHPDSKLNATAIEDDDEWPEHGLPKRQPLGRHPQSQPLQRIASALDLDLPFYSSKSADSNENRSFLLDSILRAILSLRNRAQNQHSLLAKINSTLASLRSSMTVGKPRNHGFSAQRFFDISTTPVGQNINASKYDQNEPTNPTSRQLITNTTAGMPEMDSLTTNSLKNEIITGHRKDNSLSNDFADSVVDDEVDNEQLKKSIRDHINQIAQYIEGSQPMESTSYYALQQERPRTEATDDAIVRQSSSSRLNASCQEDGTMNSPSCTDDETHEHEINGPIGQNVIRISQENETDSRWMAAIADALGVPNKGTERHGECQDILCQLLHVIHTRNTNDTVVAAQTQQLIHCLGLVKQATLTCLNASRAELITVIKNCRHRYQQRLANQRQQTILATLHTTLANLGCLNRSLGTSIASPSQSRH